RVVVADDGGELQRDGLRERSRRRCERHGGEEHEEALHRGLHEWSGVGSGGWSSIPGRTRAQGGGLGAGWCAGGGRASPGVDGVSFASQVPYSPEHRRSIVMVKNYYRVLGVRRTADNVAIKTAFRRMARRYHPDVARIKRDARRF